MIVGVPTHGMRVCQPSKEFRQLLVRPWLNHKVPVIGHQTIGKNRQWNSSDGFGKHSIECFVVVRLFKQCQSRHSSVEHMEAHSSRAFSRTSGHLPSVTMQNHRVKRNDELRPLLPFQKPLLAVAAESAQSLAKNVRFRHTSTRSNLTAIGVPNTIGPDPFVPLLHDKFRHSAIRS